MVHQKGLENQTPVNQRGESDYSAKVWRELNKRPDETLKEMRTPSDTGLNNPGISSLPKIKVPLEGGGRSISTSRGEHSIATGDRQRKLGGTIDNDDISTRAANSRLPKPGERHLPHVEITTLKSKQSKPEPSAGEKEKKPKEDHERKAHGSKTRYKDDDDKDKSGKGEDRERKEKANLTTPELPEAKFKHPHTAADKPGPYVPGVGPRDPRLDPALNPLGRAIVNAEQTSDNFQLMKTVKGLSDTDLRNEAEKAQSVINRDLGHPSVRIGVDEDNIHIYFKRTDLTLPYDAATDKKLAPDVTDQAVRNEITERLKSGVPESWRAAVTELKTPELALFDAISRSDGPALRSAMSGIKSAEQLEEHFQRIAQFANEQGISNWGNIIWSNDLKSLTVYNGTSLYSGKFPIETKPAT